MRKRRGWTQADLARRLGVPRERLGKWERGLNAPCLEDLAALSEVLEVPLGELGLGRSVQGVLSAGELTQMVSHFNEIARLLRPKVERRSPQAVGGARGGPKT